MVINGNLGSFLAFPKRETKEAASLATVTFSHFCGYLEMKKGRMFFMCLWKFSCKRPPGESDMILNMTTCFSSTTRWEHCGADVAPSQTGSQVCCT